MTNFQSLTQLPPPTLRSAKLARTDVATRHILSLDGLRGVAVLLVMLHHAGAPFFGFGLIGVDLFFVLSGFLITTLLAKEYERNGTISLPKFWGRRFLRLMPAYWLFIGSITVLLLIDPRPVSAQSGWSIRQFIASMWLYFNNYAPRDVTYWQIITGHLWSLCVEEQFYIIWPVICVLILRLRRPELVAWSLLVAVLVRRHYAQSVAELMYRLDTRGFAIIFGCATALSLRGSFRYVIPWLSGRRLSRIILAITGLTLIICSICYMCLPLFFDTYSRWLLPVLASEFAMITAMLWYGPTTAFTRMLSFKPLVYVGKISYGMYLYHPVAHYLTWKVWLVNIEYWPRVPKYSLRLAVFLALSLLFASSSYHLYERFFLRLKGRLY